jgi:cellulose synthase/poly-beta-1,6-N-acetylglucosamine synthase-like glycosyltransferase
MPPLTSALSNFAEGLFWCSAGAILYAYIGYPVLLVICALFFRRRKPADDHTPPVTVLIAAYNEEAGIVRKVRNTLELRYPQDRLEIVVVSDGSTDGTDDAVRRLNNPRVRLLRVEGRRGKTHAQNEAVEHCRGEIIVFSDATTVYHPDSVRRLVRHYSDPRVGAVSGRYQYFDSSGRSPSGFGSIAFWNYENVIKALQSRIATLTGCSGCIYSVRKSCYTPLPDDACSDLVEALAVVRNGYRVKFEPEALAFEETTASTQEEFRMRVRVATRGMRGVLSVPELLKPWQHPWTAFQLFSHKVLRWLIPVFLFGILVTSAVLSERPAFRYLLTLEMLACVLALASLVIPLHKRWKPLGLPLYFSILNAAFVVSLFEVLRGRRYVTWETVRASGTAAASHGASESTFAASRRNHA